MSMGMPFSTSGFCDSTRTTTPVSIPFLAWRPFGIHEFKHHARIYAEVTAIFLLFDFAHHIVQRNAICFHLPVF